MTTHRHTCTVCGVNLQCNNNQCPAPDSETTSNCGIHSAHEELHPVFTAIVRRALASRVVCLGQLSHRERLSLERAVRRGILVKGQGGPFPKIKSAYAAPGFDFAADREADEADLRRAHMIDLARGTDRFFPWVPFQAN